MGSEPILSLALAPASQVGFWAVAGFLQQYQCLCPSAAKAPHFSRLGDVEVNAGQNATFQCVAAGKAAEAERFLMQVSNGSGETSISTVNPVHRFCNTSMPPR